MNKGVFFMKYVLLLYAMMFSITISAASFTFKGMHRTYFVHVPECYKKDNAVPLVVVLHGGKGKAKKMKRFMHFNEISEKENFIVVYPQSYKLHWNDGRGEKSIHSQRLDIDDVGFIRSVIDTMCTQYNIDNKRIYVTGPSNGGFMCWRIACELGERIAAIASVAAAFPAGTQYKNTLKNPMPVMLISGTADPITPYNGGGIYILWKARGMVLSVRETIDYWVMNNRCSEKPVKVDLPNKNTTDKTIASQETYTDNSGKGEVVLITIANGGHTIPGGKQYWPRRIIGRICRDFTAEDVIWDFFKRHERNESEVSDNSDQSL